MIDVSLIIPTHNRAASLDRALRSAIRLDYPTDRFEIIVVDNASTDNTEAVVTGPPERSARVPIHYVREERLGLHNARHAGARSSSGGILVFTDDDATFDPAWLSEYVSAFAAHPEMVAAGGPVRPLWEAPPPAWLLHFIEDGRYAGLLSLIETPGPFQLGPRHVFYGVNMAIRRHILFEVGGFNPEAFGDTWLGDGETGLNRKLRQRGMLIGVVPRALVHHHIPPHRMTLEYLRHRMKNEGACDAYAVYHTGLPHGMVLRAHSIGLALAALPFRVIDSVLQGKTDQYAIRMQLRSARVYSRQQYVARLCRDPELRRLVLKDDWLGPSAAPQTANGRR